MAALKPAADMERWLAQPVLFASKLSRRALLDLAAPPAEGPQDPMKRVNVWRNHAFEPLLPLLAPFIAQGRWQAAWAFSDYDDGLQFAGHAEAELELLWLDRSRLKLQGEDFTAWLRTRLQALRALSPAPLLLATWPANDAEAAALQTLADSLPGCAFADLAAAARDEGTPLLDGRTAALAGTPLAAAAQAVLARRLACHWLPALLLPPLKALALDLDHTLHEGVLGEDGVQGVRLTPGHAALQRAARELRERGIFLALVSRNEAADVQRLFEERSDYPLRWTDFSVTEVSWGPKAEALQRVAKALRIAPEAVLFVDDNAGELAQVAAALPQLPSLHAQADAEATRRALGLFPGLWRFKAGADDARRVADLAGNSERERAAAAAATPEELFAQLQVRLSVSANDPADLPRAAELARKTNQFNLAVARLAEADLASRIAQPATAGVAMVRLSDRLADSGAVALLAVRRETDASGAVLHVDELCISCRAMGRQLEDPLVLLALQTLPALQGAARVVFHTDKTERNAPARRWLAALLGRGDDDLEPGRHELPAERVRAYVPPPTLAVQTEGPDITSKELDHAAA